MVRFLERIKSVFNNRRLDAELESEIAAHLDLAAEENMRLGMPAEEARRRAALHFGGLEVAKELHRDTRGLPQFEALVQDVRYTARSLLKNPGFAAVAILTLALGIGANTAIFTVINAVILRPLQYFHPEQLVTWRHNESLLDVEDIRAQAITIFSAGGAVNPETMDYTGGGEPLELHAGYADAGFFQVFGIAPMLGRTFSADEDRQGGPRTVVLAHRFWRQYLSGDPDILGKTIPLSGNGYKVIGVMPPTFAAPEFDLDVFVSLRVVYPEAARYRGVHFMRAYWRLHPGVTLAQANAGMRAIDARLGKDYPGEEKNRHTAPVALQEWVSGPIRPALWILFGAVCLVLLIACANFASLLAARSIARRREMVVRSALGGSRSRLLRQCLTESSLLAMLGGVAGLLTAKVGIRLLVAAKPAALAHFDNIAIDSTVLVFTLTIVLLTGVIFGLLPAQSASQANLADTLKQETRTASIGGSGHRLRRMLIVAEMAMALILLAGAGLLIKTVVRLRSVEPGFNPANVVSIYMHLPAKRYEEIPKQIAFRRELLDRLNSTRRVQAAMVGDLPLTGSEVTHNLAFEGRTVAVGDEPEVDTLCVMGDYFRVMQIPLLAGRTLQNTDREDQPLVAVINQALARQYFHQQNPVGQRIRWARETGTPRWMTIVGVVADVKQYSLVQPASPAVFTPFAQSNEAWRRWMSVVARVPDGQTSSIQFLKERVWSLDNQISLNRIESMNQLLLRSFAERRFNMFLLTIFAGLATILAGVGVYGVMSYAIGQRTHEFGIRMAVGAGRNDVLKLVLKEGARLAAVGLSTGMVGVLLLTRFMKSLLFDVKPTDPFILGGVFLLMLAVTLLACVIPARRAVKADPLVALRYE